MSSIASFIDGVFDGWRPGDIYTLEDGSRWRLLSPVVRVKVKVRPRATVSKSGGRYFLKVQDMGKKVEVEPVQKATSPLGLGPIPRDNARLAAHFMKLLELERKMLEG